VTGGAELTRLKIMISEDPDLHKLYDHDAPPGRQQRPLLRTVWTQEQVPDRLPFAQRQPPAFLMLSPVVNEMAALAQRLQVPRPILGRIMVEVGAGQDHLRLIPGEGRGQLSGYWQPPQRSASA
jgi:hypothetical protein